MLHEILLSLSGHPSPLLHQSIGKDPYSATSQDFPLLSSPERALLASLAHLGDLHQKLRQHTKQITSSHPSTTCRSVSSAISSQALGAFQQKIVQVERGILNKDADYVGGYGIVPLSTVVAEFAPWVRRMEWLWDMAQFMLPLAQAHEKDNQKSACTGAAVMDRLRNKSHTGYKDIEEMATTLVQVAEAAWMRQLSTWVLYGKLPPIGTGDFFIRASTMQTGGTLDGVTNFRVDSVLLPAFVNSQTASSILFIGKSLNHIRALNISSQGGSTRALVQTDMALLPTHLRYLTELRSPISASGISATIAEIRVSLSQNSLSQLLPLPRIVETLSLLHAFPLLGRGEFALALITTAEKRAQDRHRRPGLARGKSASRSLASVAMKDGEVEGVLNDTWTELLALQNEEDSVDDELESSLKQMYLKISRSFRSLRYRSTTCCCPTRHISLFTYNLPWISSSHPTTFIRTR